MIDKSASLAEIEELFSDTIISIKEISDMLAAVLKKQEEQAVQHSQTAIATQATMATMAKAHSDISVAFTLMSKTFEKAEQRQGELEITNNNLYKEKGIPPTIFFIVVGTLAIVIILGTVWITDTFIKASYSSFEAGRKAERQAERHVEDVNKQETSKDGH